MGELVYGSELSLFYKKEMKEKMENMQQQKDIQNLEKIVFKGL